MQISNIRINLKTHSNTGAIIKRSWEPTLNPAGKMKREKQQLTTTKPTTANNNSQQQQPTATNR